MGRQRLGRCFFLSAERLRTGNSGPFAFEEDLLSSSSGCACCSWEKPCRRRFNRLIRGGVSITSKDSRVGTGDFLGEEYEHRSSIIDLSAEEDSQRCISASLLGCEYLWQDLRGLRKKDICRGDSSTSSSSAVVSPSASSVVFSVGVRRMKGMSSSSVANWWVEDVFMVAVSWLSAVEECLEMRLGPSDEPVDRRDVVDDSPLLQRMVLRIWIWVRALRLCLLSSL